MIVPATPESPSLALTESAPAGSHAPQVQLLPHMVRTGSQAAPAQVAATAAAERHPPVAAVVRSSGSPSSSTTTAVATEVWTNRTSYSTQVPRGSPSVQQMVRSGTQGIISERPWAARCGGRVPISRRVSWDGPATNGSAAVAARVWTPTSLPGSGRPVNGDAAGDPGRALPLHHLGAGRVASDRGEQRVAVVVHPGWRAQPGPRNAGTGPRTRGPPTRSPRRRRSAGAVVTSTSQPAEARAPFASPTISSTLRETPGPMRSPASDGFVKGTTTVTRAWSPSP